MKPSGSRWQLVVALVCMAAAPAATLSAQQLTGAVEGTVADASGGVLAGATVELTNVATGISVSKTAASDGSFAFNSVKPGTYTVRATLLGFKPLRQRIEVGLNKTVKLNVVLALGDLVDVVEVTVTAPPVETVDARVGTNVASKVIVDLPNINRDITTLVELMAGARRVQGTTAGGSQVVDLSGNYALGNGTRRSQSIFYLDGSENMGAWRHQALQMPNPDTIEEVQVVSSSSSAEFGKEPGISVNAVTKSGSNVFHGTALYSTHSGSLNANTWAANRAVSPRPDDHQKWMGGTLGGPILKNRTFFFASFQHYQDNQPTQISTQRMPTARMMNGDFSEIPGFQIKAINPLTGLPIGNVIPASLINPISNQLKTRYPTIDTYNNVDRYFWGFERNVHNNEWLAKIDHRFNDEHQVSVSYLTTKGQQERPDNVSGVENFVPGFGGTTLVGARQHTASLRHTWLARSNVVIENRIAMGRLRSFRDRTEKDENLASLGGVWPDITPGVAHTVPSIFLTGGPTARGGQLSDLVQQNYRLLSTVSWTRGRHDFKFGLEGQHSNYSRFVNFDNGQFTFNGAYSNTSAPLNGPWPSLVTPSGENAFAYAWADFLLGRVRSFDATGVADNGFSGSSYFFFVQDRWRITPRLTFSPGLRYELYGTQTSKAILAGYVDGHKSNQYPNAPLGLAFEGDAGIPAGFRRADRNNLAPRLGIAYDVTGDGRTALRAGAGVYYAYPPLSIIEQLGNTIGASTIAGANASLTDPWGTARGNSGDTTCQFPGCTAPSFDRDPSKRVFVPATVVGFEPGIDTPYQYQFNVTVEREVVRGLSVEAGYVGNRAKHGFQVVDHNLAAWQPGANDGNLNARRPNRTWTGINIIESSLSESYDAGQVSASLKRKGVYAHLAYAFQRQLTTADDQAQEVGISNSPGNWTDNPRDLDGEQAPVVPRQVLRGFLTYDLPQWGSKFLDKVVGGWQIAGTFTWTDGDRLNVTLGRENNFDGFGPDRPDQAGPIGYVRTENPDGSWTWIDRSAFADPPAPSASNPYPFGTLGRNAVRGPSQFFADAAITRNFPLTAKVRFQLRADASNVFNHAILSNPNLNLTSTDFGVIRTRTGGGRTIQVQAKVIF